MEQKKTADYCDEEKKLEEKEKKIVGSKMIKVSKDPHPLDKSYDIKCQTPSPQK